MGASQTWICGPSVSPSDILSEASARAEARFAATLGCRIPNFLHVNLQKQNTPSSHTSIELCLTRLVGQTLGGEGHAHQDRQRGSSLRTSGGVPWSCSDQRS